MNTNQILTFFIAASAAIVGLLFGYDVGIISGVIIFIKPYFSLSAIEVGLIVGAVAFGAFISALFCGKLGDRYGRKSLLITTAFLFVVGSVICAIAGSSIMLCLGRAILGVAVGIGSFTVPLYISEIAPKKLRGRLVTLNQLAITLGICVAYVVNLIFSSSGDWRLMLLLGACPAILLLIILCYLPKSPRWLMANHYTKEAEAILCSIHGKDHAKREYDEIKSVLEKANHKVSIFNRKYIKPLLLGIMISIVTQAVGVNAIIYYAPTIFKLTGFSSNSTAILATLGIGLTNVVFTILAIGIIDKAGRRKLLLVGLSGIIVSLMILSVAFDGKVAAGSVAWLALFAMVFFIACQAFSTGPACWLIPSEIFPVSIRSQGVGISAACNWGTNVIVAFLFPIFLQKYGAVATFSCFLGIAVIGFIYVFFKLPETKGVSLEEIENNILKELPLRKLGA
ncbi:sugar porter family MFS transporter [Fangia hongkongensis]|uniref:sugar porter family MFS transporter n=1 Tax=Fangia hongkongensis TaxID=270495 RepID=UPI00037E51B3|nr:sugar porter family MFS transporter [Fangia hongkongensis]MBK2125464.1 sugar porter family MFS transporter [Fangia hongkongensis]